MRFTATSVPDAFIVEIEPHGDERGFFARTWCAREFAAQGLQDVLAQTSISRSERRGTVRGLHMQMPPSAEAKLVRCTQGAIYHVMIDLRPDSPGYLRHFGLELAAGRYNALYIPPLVAHGFQTLADGSEVLYQMSDFYAPQLGYGIRWDDAAFGIAWPIGTGITINSRDRDYGDFERRSYEAELARACAAAASVRPPAEAR